MVTTWRELTSPEPVPPLMVRRAPAPYRASSPGPARGKDPSEASSTMDSGAFSRTVARWSISYWFSGTWSSFADVDC